MEIGVKIKNARIEANLTQEQVAESLGVSRQTISNWETEKSFPDILYVVKMSELYNVSLDYLLKGNKPVSEYINYLNESTDMVKSKERFSKLIIIVMYLLVLLSSTVFFWCYMEPGDEMGFIVLFQCMIYPVIALVLSIIIGYHNYWNNYKWLISIYFGIIYSLSMYTTFAIYNFDLQGLIFVPIGIVVSLIGILIGHTVRKIVKRGCKKVQT